MMETKGKVHQ